MTSEREANGGKGKTGDFVSDDEIELQLPETQKPKAPAAPPQEVSNLYRLAVSFANICCSSSMIVFNKWLMSKGRFPFAAALTCFHMTSGFLFALAVKRLKPDILWGFDSVWNAEKGFWRAIAKMFLPLGFLYAGNLFLANRAYLFCSVAFLQMMKEINIPLVYILGIFAGLDKFDTRRSIILLFILLAAMSFVAGEVNFSVIGFAIQSGSQCFEVCRITMQSWLLQGSKKVDPVTMLMFMCPCCFLGLLGPLYYFWHPDIPAKAWEYKWPLLANCMLAVMLNTCTVLLQQIATPAVYMLVGVVKDVGCVSVSAIVLEAPLTIRQILSGVAVLGGIIVHTVYRTSPEWLKTACCLPDRPASPGGKVAPAAPKRDVRRALEVEKESMIHGLKPTIVGGSHSPQANISPTAASHPTTRAARAAEA